MATHSSILAWRIPWAEEPGRLPSRGHKETSIVVVINTSIMKFNYNFFSTGELSYQGSSHTVAKVLGPTKDFQAC